MSEQSPARDDPHAEYRLAVFLAGLTVFHALLLLVLPFVLSDQIQAAIHMTVPLCIGGSIAFLLTGALLAVNAAGIRRIGGPHQTEPD